MVNRDKNKEPTLRDTIEWAKKLNDDPPANSTNSVLVILCIGAFSVLIAILLLWITVSNDQNKKLNNTSGDPFYNNDYFSDDYDSYYSTDDYSDYPASPSVTRDTRGVRDVRDQRDQRDVRDVRDQRDQLDVRDVRDVRDGRHESRY